MEMWLKRLSLVFLTVAVAAMVTSGQNLVTLDDEKQRSVKVSFGSPLSFNCNFSTARYHRFRVTWYFNPSGPSFDEKHNISIKMCYRSAKTSIVVEDDGQDTQDTLLNHTLSATEENSGWYFCKIIVDIPDHYTFISNGTKVIITKSVEHTTHPSTSIVTAPESPPGIFQRIDWWLWSIMGVSTFILIVLLIVCIILRRRSRRSRVEDPVYANTHRVPHKQPSPRPEMLVGNLKPVSSSQNLRNPSPGRRHDEDRRRYR